MRVSSEDVKVFSDDEVKETWHGVWLTEDAPLKMVYITDVDHPERENWQVYLAEHETDKLSHISTINGYIYASYTHNTYSLVKIYDLEGIFVRDFPFQTIGSSDDPEQFKYLQAYSPYHNIKQGMSVTI